MKYILALALITTVLMAYFAQAQRHNRSQEKAQDSKNTTIKKKNK